MQVITEDNVQPTKKTLLEGVGGTLKVDAVIT